MTELTYTTISTYEQVMGVWDQVRVLVREVTNNVGETNVRVYPQLDRGVMYPEMKLHHDVCLWVMPDVEHALMWCRSRGLEATVIR